MKQFKDFIARRRPAAPFPTAEDPRLVEGVAAVPAPDPFDPENGFVAADLERAKMASTSVPRHFEAPTWPRSGWVMEDSPKSPSAAESVPTGIWDLESEDAQDEPAASSTAEAEAAPVPIPTPAAAVRPMTTLAPTPLSTAAQAPAAATSGRVKTRLLGFGAAAPQRDAFASATEAPASPETRFPVGWLVVVEGPGRGAAFALGSGLSSIGRGEDQSVRLDFGDAAISRSNHAAIAWDPEDRRVLIGHGGKSNLVRLNGEPLLSREELTDGALIRIGRTTLRFVALCGPDFAWEDGEDDRDMAGEND